jgi:aspartyl protease family protein
MTGEGGPWSAPPPKPEAPRPPARARGGLLVWLAVVAVVGAAVLALAQLFPEAIRGGDDWARVGYFAALLAVLASGLTRFRRESLPTHLRHAGIWLAIVAVAALAAAYRDELASIPRRVQMAFSPGTAIATSEHELVIPQNDEGSFVVVGLVNGQRVRFIVDTGATDTVLAPADARRLGVPVDDLRFEHMSETANGTGLSAPYQADRLEIGPIAFDDFKMSVNQADMSASLLGMSFLSRLKSFEFRGRTLVLKWRGPKG